METVGRTMIQAAQDMIYALMYFLGLVVGLGAGIAWLICSLFRRDE